MKILMTLSGGLFLTASCLGGPAALDVGFVKRLIAIPSESRSIPECNRATACLKDYLERRGVHCHVELTGLEPETLYCVPPVENDPNDPLVRDLLAAMKRNWGASFRDVKMVAATDAFQFADLGLPTVIYCPDAHGAHQDDEHGSLKSAAAYLEFFTRWLKEAR